MSDDLVKRWDEYVESMGCVMGEVEHMAQLMRDRVKELEERLENEMSDTDASDRRAKRLHDRIEELEADLRQTKISEIFWRDGWYALDQDKRAVDAKLAKVVTAYRIEAMRRDGYTHDAFDRHIAELTGGKDE